MYRFIALNFVERVDFIIGLRHHFKIFRIKNLFTLTRSLPVSVLGKIQKKTGSGRYSVLTIRYKMRFDGEPYV